MKMIIKASYNCKCGIQGLLVMVKRQNGGWRDGSVVKTTCCSCREALFNSMSSGPYLPVTLVPGALTMTSGLLRCIPLPHAHNLE